MPAGIRKVVAHGSPVAGQYPQPLSYCCSSPEHLSQRPHLIFFIIGQSHWSPKLLLQVFAASVSCEWPVDSFQRQHGGNSMLLRTTINHPAERSTSITVAFSNVIPASPQTPKFASTQNPQFPEKFLSILISYSCLEINICAGSWLLPYFSTGNKPVTFPSLPPPHCPGLVHIRITAVTKIVSPLGKGKICF